MDVINNMNEQQATALLANDTELDVLLDVAASLRDEGHRARARLRRPGRVRLRRRGRARVRIGLQSWSATCARVLGPRCTSSPALRRIEDRTKEAPTVSSREMHCERQMIR